MRGPAVEAVYATGTVEPVLWVKVGPKATGRIADILVREGDPVKRGTVLARLDDREVAALVKQQAAREEFLRDEEARRQKLFDKQLISRQDYIVTHEAHLAQQTHRRIRLIDGRIAEDS